MPGPMPKDPKLRQRRNKATTRALLPAETSVQVDAAEVVEYPQLPERATGEPWHPLAVRWWHDVWSSPMHQEFLRADAGALFRLAHFVDAFWKTGSLKYAAEIRLMEREFGLTPLARRRLEWTVAQTEGAAGKREPQRAKTRVINQDPRGVLDA